MSIKINLNISKSQIPNLFLTGSGIITNDQIPNFTFWYWRMEFIWLLEIGAWNLFLIQLSVGLS
jgi:hypothetical protein